MEHLKRIYAQLRDLYLSMTPGNRIIAALLFLTLLISLGYLVVGSISTGNPKLKEIALYNGLNFTQEEQRAVEDALSQSGLNAHRWVGDQLFVPRSSRANYAVAIASAKALDIRGNARKQAVTELTPWASSKMIDEKKINATALDVTDEIMRTPGISSASVIPSLRKTWDRNIWAKKDVFSVSVFVDTVNFKPLDNDIVSAIGAMVQAAFHNADLNEIKIFDRRNGRIYDGAGEDLSGGRGDYLRQQARHQKKFKDQIYDLLSHIEGLNVETTVDLTKHLTENIFQVEHGKPTKLTEHTLGLDYLKIGYDRFGRPGQIAQMSSPLIEPQADWAGGAKTTEKKHENEYTNALQGQEVKTDIVPFTPIRVLASLRIPHQHVFDTWLRETNRQGASPAEPTEEELETVREKIRTETKRSVSQLLMPWWIPKLNPDPLSMVTVEFYTPPREEEVVLTNWQQILIFLKENWQTLSLIGIILCGMGVLWSMAKRQKPEPIVLYESPDVPLEVIEARVQELAKAQAEAKAAVEAEEAAAQEEEINRTLDSFGSIRSLKDEIAELIAENPDAAAAVLRQWIGNAVLVERNT